MMIMPHGIKYEPEAEHSADLHHNDGRSVEEAGYVKDECGFYEPCSSDRRDSWGGVVSHQDSKSFPGPRGLGTF